MEIQFYKSVFIGLFFLLAAVICYVYKKKNMMVFTIFIGIFFFLRSGIIYMAIDFEPPEIKKEKVKSESAAPMEMDVSMPKYKLYDNRKIGFGLDFLE